VSNIIALLGRREMPTDGIDDNCAFLGEALARRGHHLEKYRVEWARDGWLRALRQLSRDADAWRDKWVILQFTSLAWSRRGFPIGAWLAMKILRKRGARFAVYYHEPTGFDGPRSIDRIRGACQEWVIRALYRGADRPIFADPLDKIPWLARERAKANTAFIPIGASVPEPPRASGNPDLRRETAQRTIAVYCVGDPPYLQQELDDITGALRPISGNGWKMRVNFFGRGTAEAQADIGRAFDQLPIEVHNFGLQSADRVAGHLAEADVMICVRGKLFPRRSSAIAGITCAVPMVAYAGACEGTHVAEAGVDLVPYRDIAALSTSLKRLLEDDRRWNEFRRRSLRIHDEYLAWDTIAEKFTQALRLEETRA
jgi:glycosyltransferase involved in cell wall biosynthesis